MEGVGRRDRRHQLREELPRGFRRGDRSAGARRGDRTHREGQHPRRAEGPEEMKTAAAPAEITTVGADRLAVRGALTFATARLASAAGLRALTASAARRLEIDLAGVTAADSAGLPVCLGWLPGAGGAGRGGGFA